MPALFALGVAVMFFIFFWDDEVQADSLEADGLSPISDSNTEISPDTAG
jgi:hypothetical protein